MKFNEPSLLEVYVPGRFSLGVLGSVPKLRIAQSVMPGYKG